MKRARLLVISACAIAAAAACAPSRSTMRAPVDDVVARRIGESVRLASPGGDTANGEGEDDALVAKLLDGGVEREEAVQIALLANPALLSTYEELGLNEARALSMSLVRNPRVHAGAHVSLTEEGHTPDFELGIEQDLVSLLFLPGSMASASASVDAARARVAGAVVETAAVARAAHARAVAAAQLVELRKESAASTEAALVLARRMHDAGNARDLDLLRETARHQEALLALADAERAANVELARLAATLGLSGARAALAVPRALDEATLDDDTLADDVALDNLEQRAVTQSFALEAGRHELDALARRLGYVNVRRFLPSLEVGATFERDHDEYEAGPHVSIALPLFDAGPAEMLELESRVRQQGAMWRADAIELRAAAREVATNARAVGARARYLRDQVLPTQRALVEETVRQYNAMQIDTFALLDAQRREVSARELYVAALRDAWIVRAEIEVLRAGGRPRNGGTAAGSLTTPSAPLMTTSADAHGGH